MLSLQSILIPIAVSGAAIAYLFYRMYANRAPSDEQELHTEICEERESLRCVVEVLPAQLEAAKRSGMTAVSELEVDMAEAKLLRSQLPAADFSSTDPMAMELDIQLAEILALSIRANRLAEKYRRALSEERIYEDISSEDYLNAETLFEQAASLPAQARAQHAAMSFVAPS